MDKISIIVPAYNQDAYITRCLLSILGQSYDETSIVIVDDGSTDRSGEICDSVLRDNSNIMIIHEANAGLSVARNVGIDMNEKCIQADWITFIDSDDWVHNRYLESMISSAKENGVNLVATEYKRTDQEIEDDTLFLNTILLTPEEFICMNRTLFSVACCKLYRASCFEIVRFPVGKLNEDEFTTYKILFKEKEIAFICSPLYYYFINPQSITRSEWTPQRMDVIEALYDQMKFYSKNKFSNAYNDTLKCYLWILYDFSKASKDNFPQIAKELKKRFIKDFKRNRLLFDISDYGYYYKAALPAKYIVRLLINKIVKLINQYSVKINSHFKS